MSAAEKLKALGQPWWTDYDIDRLLPALPQIVAVVEAAELGRHYTKAMHSWHWEQGDVAIADQIHGSLDRIDAALAALDEALP